MRGQAPQIFFPRTAPAYSAPPNILADIRTDGRKGQKGGGIIPYHQFLDQPLLGVASASTAKAVCVRRAGATPPPHRRFDPDEFLQQHRISQTLHLGVSWLV